MPGRSRRTASPVPWGELTDEVHGRRPVTLSWPWAPGDSVTVTFLRRGYAAGSSERVVTPAIVDDDTGELLEPAVTETVERWVHVVDHPEWGENPVELPVDHPVTVGEVSR